MACLPGAGPEVGPEACEAAARPPSRRGARRPRSPLGRSGPDTPRAVARRPRRSRPGNRAGSEPATCAARRAPGQARPSSSRRRGRARDQIAEPGQVLGGEPEAAGLGGIGVEQHDAVGNPAQLAQSLEAVTPVMVAQHSHRRIEAGVLERELLGGSSHAGSRPGGRWAIITSEGSTATTSRSGGS